MDDRRRAAWALSLVAFAYLYVSPYYPGINNPNENVRFFMTAAMVEHGQYHIDPIRKRWGWVNDAAVHDGRVYSVKAPGASFLGVPAYAAYYGLSRLKGEMPDRHVALWVTRVGGVVLPMLLSLWWLRRFLSREITEPLVRDGVLLSVALGSLIYAYSLIFVSHSLSGMSAMGALMCLHALRQGRAARPWLTALFAGLCTSGVTCFEYPGLVVTVPLAALGVWQLRRDRRALLGLAIGGALPALAMMHFQAVSFGSPWTPGHIYSETAAFRARHRAGLYGTVGFDWQAFFALLGSPAKGLLPMTPLLAFAPLGLWKLARTPERRGEAIAVSVACLGLIVAIASTNIWHGGWTVGPRFLATIVPLLGWASAHGLMAAHARAPRVTDVVVLGGTLTALAASAPVSAYYPHLPPEIIRPLAQLLPTLVAHDFAPENAAGLLGLFGTASMLPWLLGMLATPVLLLWRTPGAAWKAPAAVALAGVLLLPSLHVPADAKPSEGAVAFIARKWSPAGHDRASRLQRARRHATGDERAQLTEQLRATLLAEGRQREADELRR